MSNKKKTYLLTQEWVSEGHPDKVADQISDTILDEYLKKDSNAKVACETFVMGNLCIIGGEITSKEKNIDIEGIVRNKINSIGYNRDELGFNGDNVEILNKIVEQSPEINKMVDKGELGSGDQGFMLGFASSETPDYLQLPYYLARKFGEQLKKSDLHYLRPDAKTQATIEYDENDKPVRIHTILVSTSHNPSVDRDTLVNDFFDKIVHKVLPTLPQHIRDLVDLKTLYKINPNGSFVQCGPAGDTGLTGRKIVVDHGYYTVGGGAFSGKDYSKVDRSGAYYSRYIAKNMVASGIADEVLIQVAYIIGDTDATSVSVKTKNNHTLLSDIEIGEKINSLFSFKPKDIVETLKLKNPIYEVTASNGHFGRESYINSNGIEYFTWEKLDIVDKLKEAFKDDFIGLEVSIDSIELSIDNPF